MLISHDPSAAFTSICPTQLLTRGPKDFALVGAGSLATASCSSAKSEDWMPSALRNVDKESKSPLTTVIELFCWTWPPWLTLPRTPWKLSIRSEEHTSELQSLMRISYAVFCLKK